MSSKVILLLALLCVSLSLSSAAARRPRRLGAISGEALVQKTCKGIGEYEAECLKVLRASDKLDKGEAMDLAFFALRYAEGYATNLTVALKKAASEPEIEPVFQAALAECTEQYIPLDDLVEDAINAMLAMANSDSSDFIGAAITGTEMCGTQLQSTLEEGVTNPELKDDVKVAEGLKKQNDFLKGMLNASLNVVALNN